MDDARDFWGDPYLSSTTCLIMTVKMFYQGEILGSLKAIVMHYCYYWDAKVLTISCVGGGRHQATQVIVFIIPHVMYSIFMHWYGVVFDGI